MLWMRMARSESPDTRLLHSLFRRRLSLLSIYSAQRLRDREQVYVVRSTGVGVTKAPFVNFSVS